MSNFHIFEYIEICTNLAINHCFWSLLRKKFEKVRSDSESSWNFTSICTKSKIKNQFSCKKKYLWKVFFFAKVFFLWSIIAPWPIWQWISTPIIYFTRRMVQYMPTNYSVGPHRVPLVRKSRFEVHFPYCTIWCSKCYCTIVLHGRETAYPNWL